MQQKICSLTKIFCASSAILAISLIITPFSAPYMYIHAHAATISVPNNTFGSLQTVFGTASTDDTIRYGAGTPIINFAKGDTIRLTKTNLTSSGFGGGFTTIIAPSSYTAGKELNAPLFSSIDGAGDGFFIHNMAMTTINSMYTDSHGEGLLGTHSAGTGRATATIGDILNRSFVGIAITTITIEGGGLIGAYSNTTTPATIASISSSTFSTANISGHIKPVTQQISQATSLYLTASIHTVCALEHATTTP